MTKGYAESQHKFYKEQWQRLHWLYGLALCEYHAIRTPYPYKLEKEYKDCTEAKRYWFNVSINSPE